MTQYKRPPEQPETRESHAGPRECVRQRMRQMARLALVAATPLTNAACDPVPSPVAICEESPSNWARWEMSAAAVWVTEGGERIVQLAVGSLHDPPLQAPSSYTLEGGTFLPPPPNYPNLLRIKPDVDVTVIRLTGTATCKTVTASMVITIELLPSNQDPTVVIDVG